MQQEGATCRVGIDLEKTCVATKEGEQGIEASEAGL